MTPPDTTPRPAVNTNTHISYNDTLMGQIVYTLPSFPNGGPPCVWDNGPTQRTGSCYTCILCGSTTSCG